MTRQTALPGAVSKRADQAREALAKLNAPASDDSTPGVADPGAPAERQERIPPAIPARPVVVAERSEPPAPAEETSSIPESQEPVKPRAPGEKVKLNDWKRRYELLAAGRSERQIKLERENEELRAQLAKKEVRTASPETPDASKSRYELSKDEREYLGEKEAGTLERLSSHVDDRLDRLERERLEQERVKRQRFYDDLSTVAPGWERLDEDPGFNRWLDNADPDTGVLRRDAFDRLVADGNAQVVGQIVKAYMATEKATSAGIESEPEPATQASPEPGTSRPRPPANAGGPAEPEYITRAEIKAHSLEKARLYRTGRPVPEDVAARIAARDAEIQQAMHERRIL